MNNDDKRSQEEIIEELSNLVEELGWVIGLPDGTEKVPGLIVGEQNFVIEVVKSYYGENFDIYTKNDETGQSEIIHNPDKKTLH